MSSQETTLARRTFRPGVFAVLVGVTLVAWVLVLARMRGMDAGPGTDLGSARLVPRDLGDDDGSDDAALGDADGDAVLEGLAGVVPPAQALRQASS